MELFGIFGSSPKPKRSSLEGNDVENLQELSFELAFKKHSSNRNIREAVLEYKEFLAESQGEKRKSVLDDRRRLAELRAEIVHELSVVGVVLAHEAKRFDSRVDESVEKFAELFVN